MKASNMINQADEEIAGDMVTNTGHKRRFLTSFEYLQENMPIMKEIPTQKWTLLTQRRAKETKKPVVSRHALWKIVNWIDRGHHDMTCIFPRKLNCKLI